MPRKEKQDDQHQLRRRARQALERTMAGQDFAAIAVVDDREARARIASAVARLPGAERDVLLALRGSAWSVAQWAERTGLTLEEAEQQFAGALDGVLRNLDDPLRGWWRRWRR